MSERDLEPLKWASGAFRDSATRNRYTIYRNYTEGRQPLNFASPKYAQVFSILFEAFAYNRCNTVVDAHADRMHIERFETGSQTQDDLIKEIWGRNRMDRVSGEIHKAMFRLGDAYVIVWPEEQRGNGDTAPFPTIWPQDPDTVRVRYDKERPGRITMAAKTWFLDNKTRRLNLYFPDRIEKYVTVSRSESPLPVNVNTFERWQDPEDESWPVENPWNIVPVFHFANNADTGQQGISELRDIIPLQDALNKTVTDLLLASEMVGMPQKVLLGLDSGDSKVMEALQRLQVGLNKIITIPNDPSGKTPSIAEFSAGNLAQQIAVVELFDKLISRVSRVPVYHLQMTGDFPSGRAMRTADGPFVGKIEDRQVGTGNTWEDVAFLAALQAGTSEGAIAKLDAIWRPAAPLAEEDKWDLALQKSTVGMPLDQILREAGYDEETITKIKGEVDRVAATMDVSLTGIGGGDQPADRSVAA